MKRRDFLKSSATLAATTSLTPALLFADKTTPLGIQLWSVRDAMAKDAVGTLKTISKYGFKFVEGFGFKDGLWFGLTPAEMKKNLSGLGMSMKSNHQMVTTKDYDKSTKQLSDDFKKAVDAGLQVGQKYIICPYMADTDRNKESVLLLTEIFNKAGEYCNAKGLRFGYHNHAFEFDMRFEEQPMYKLLLDNTDPKLVAFEMDLCWVVRANYNPVDWFKLYPGRFELTHVKDLAKYGVNGSTIIGQGVVDFKQIIAAQKEGGVKHWIVELEEYTKDGSVADVGLCYNNFRKMI
jgi:sugar phosphate isomerase/epimerase